eukprot:5067132-Pyramimonas_sp.AAC.1
MASVKNWWENRASSPSMYTLPECTIKQLLHNSVILVQYCTTFVLSRLREAGPPGCPAQGRVPCRPPLPGSPSSVEPWWGGLRRKKLPE